MRTPAQIAREVFSDGMKRETSIQDLMVRAIEADRAQRAFTETELDDLLSEWEALEGDVDGFYEKWVAKINRGEA